MKKRKKVENFKLFIIVGFVTLYIVGMILITYLTKEQYENFSMTSASHITRDMIAEIEDVELIYKEDGTLGDYCLDYMQYILSSNVESMSQYALVSAGLLDADGDLMAQTADCYYESIPYYLNGEPRFNLIDFSEYFTEEEMDRIRGYYEVEKQKTYPDLDNGYGAKLAYDEENKELVHLYIKESEERKMEDGAVEEVYLDVIFRYLNPDYIGKDLKYPSLDWPLDSYMTLPYLQYGKETWEEWKKNGHLHNYFQGVQTDKLARAYNDRIYEKYEKTYVNRICLGDNSEKNYDRPDYVLITNVKLYPWQAAIDQLSDLYIFSALFVAVCMMIVLYFTDKTYKKQAQLEQTRHDFTNAVAHELKTPLAIVRGLAETMEETGSEEKKSIYRAQIVNQTEIMDGLVKEMIFISKMDSEQMILKKESISVFALIEEQTDKLKHFIEGKNLGLQYRKEGDFLIEGDRTYLEKALFNLIENAVSYNKQNGKICIHATENSCTIVNTAEPIPEEDLPHVCEMFFTGNKSRSADANHKGLGLYLAKRIFEMHGIRLEIGNMDVGVKVELQVMK